MTARRLCRGERRFTRRGTAIVEMAIVLPLLLLLLFGIIEFGHLLFVRHNMINAATQGTRAGIMPEATDASVRATVTRALEDSGVGGLAMTTNVIFNDIVPNPPDLVGTLEVEVEVTSTYAEVSIFGGFLPDSLVIYTHSAAVR